ncbi:MAG: cation tolerance protein CutA [Planctomycetes bacterium RBG_16_59_8]|nr:MAG: cation tolerance protein CutA [Planctomycetes bacterium RBG_16_59_8]
MSGYVAVLCSCGGKAEARRLARTIVREKLGACVSVIPSVASVYRWKGKVEESRESLLLIKTTRSLFRKLERRLREIHSYEVPEIIALPIAAGSAPYLRWLAESVGTDFRSPDAHR